MKLNYSSIKTQLTNKGYIYINQSRQLEEFFLLAKYLGSCELISSIKIIPNSKTYINKESFVPLHSDCPLIKYVGWYCKEQDDYDGSSILSDAYSVLKILQTNEIKLLEDTIIMYPDYKSANYYETTILKETISKKHIYYAPWLIKNETDRHNLRFFNDKLYANTFSIRLKDGEMLFIDNHRMLHGRNAISSSSKRILERIWIG